MNDNPRTLADAMEAIGTLSRLMAGALIDAANDMEDSCNDKRLLEFLNPGRIGYLGDEWRCSPSGRHVNRIARKVVERLIEEDRLLFDIAPITPATDVEG